MTKINIFSGFLGAGKTTLIQKLIEDGFKDKIASATCFLRCFCST